MCVILGETIDLDQLTSPRSEAGQICLSFVACCCLHESQLTQKGRFVGVEKFTMACPHLLLPTVLRCDSLRTWNARYTVKGHCFEM